MGDKQLSTLAGARTRAGIGARAVACAGPVTGAGLTDHECLDSSRSFTPASYELLG